MSRLLLFCSMFALASLSYGQDFSFGFKTGLNFNEIKGEAEEGANVSETFDRNVGFHFGATFAWNMTDLMGLRGEFMYSQKGTRRSFKGDSYYNFVTTDDRIMNTTGFRSQELSVNNSYIEIPVTFYVKPVPKVEIYGGASFGFLVSSTAFGNIEMSNIVDDIGSPTTPSTIDHELNFNFFTDKPGERTLGDPASTIKIKNENVPYPQTAGAYYEFQEDRGKLYKGIDLGLVGGISFYLSRSLYVSGRLNYGLMDITKTKADVSLSALDKDKNFITRNDDDHNVSIQASIGFSF
ncbi:MAG: PorT family protein [Saprospiraceae bacterium]|nr:PorT family protein [Saprospiraceae bacterium]